MAKKKDKDELEQVEGKAIKNAKSLQDKQRENEEKLQAELKASVEGYFSNMFQYTLVKGILLLDVEQGVTLEHFEIKNIEDIKNMFENEVENDKNVIHKSQKENIGLIDDLFNVRDLIGVVDGDLRMLEGEDIDGKPFEMDTERVLLVKCLLPGFNRLRLVGTLRIPKGITDIFYNNGNSKYLNV